jgi:hypothetical protein
VEVIGSLGVKLVADELFENISCPRFVSPLKFKGKFGVSEN